MQARGAYSSGYGGSNAPYNAASGLDNPYARSSSQGAYTSGKRKGGKSKKVLIGILVVLLVAVVGCAGAAFAYISSLDSKMSSGVDKELLDALENTAYTGDPFYVLLMGVDSSEDRENSAEFAGDTFRSDSMILARIDPQNKKVAMISIPRDTMVEIDGYGTQKINAAHALGGPALAVKAVSKLAGVPISHYAEINFDGFEAVVDSLGGVYVDVPMEINDHDAGGMVEAGPQWLNGLSCLVLCRARHAYDEYGAGDLYRAANQRLVLGAIAERMLQSDPMTIANTIQTLASYVKTDMKVSDIVSVAIAMRGLNASEDVYSATAPTTSQYINDLWYEVLDTTEWNKMIQRMDQGLPPVEEAVVDEKTGTVLASNGSSGTATTSEMGTVSVKNGSGVEGVSTKAAEKIAALGYSTEVGNADNYGYKNTIVVYGNDSQADKAQDIVNALGVGTAVKNTNNEYSYTADYLVVIGADYK